MSVFLVFILLLLGSFTLTMFESITIDIVSIGFISNALGTSYASQGPPIDASVEELQDNFPNITFQLIHLNDSSITNCVQLNENTERMLAQWYYGRTYHVNMTVILNAACLEGALISRMAAGWNVLYMATGSYDYYALRDRRNNPTYLVSTAVPYSGYATLYKGLLQRYNWTSVFMVVDDDSVPIYTLLSNTLNGYLQQDANIKPLIRHFNKTWQADEFSKLLKDFSRVSRVLLFFGNANMLRTLAITAARLGMTNGEYVYITIQVLPNFPPFGNLSPMFGNSDDNITVDAYQSVLVIEPLDADILMPPSLLRRFPEFEARSVRDYNVTYKLPKGWVAITYSYLGALLYGEILKEALDENANLSDGAAFARRFLRRTLQTRIGSFYVNTIGETQVPLAVSYFNYTTSTREKFLVLQSGSSRLDGANGSTWRGAFGKGPPLNELFCGYSGNKARCLIGRDNRTQPVLWSVLCAVLIIAVLW